MSIEWLPSGFLASTLGWDACVRNFESMADLAVLVPKLPLEVNVLTLYAVLSTNGCLFLVTVEVNDVSAPVGIVTPVGTVSLAPTFI